MYLRPVCRAGVMALVGALLQGCIATAVGTTAAVGGSIAYDRRSTGAYIDDQIIELKSINAFGSDKELYDQTHINTTSFNNIVLLTGEAATEELRERAGARVGALPKVRKVYNELAVAAPSSLLSRSSDSLITSKVKASLLDADANLFARTKVVTEAGVVYLMGVVSQAEANAASEVARRVGGVQRVVKVFEYLESAT
ncbi:MAG: BON domain-containing protein [Gammaproteobacteria bacterium]